MNTKHFVKNPYLFVGLKYLPSRGSPFGGTNVSRGSPFGGTNVSFFFISFPFKSENNFNLVFKKLNKKNEFFENFEWFFFILFIF